MSDFEDPISGDYSSTVISSDSRIIDQTQNNEDMIPMLMVTGGAHKGKIIPLKADGKKNLEYTIGRGKECSFTVIDPSTSRKHVAIVSAKKGSSCFAKDLGSTNGTFVNGVKIDEPYLLNHDDRIHIGDETIIKFVIVPESEAKAQLDLYNQATKDSLTGCYNRRHFYENLKRELSMQRRGPKGRGVGVIIFDVDHFKKVNDTYGHLAGDEVLRRISKTVHECIRDEDLFARYGGEEFVILLRNDSIEGVHILAERVRVALEKEHVVFDGKTIAYTVSLGITGIIGPTKLENDELMQLADEALYEAKENGRNQTRKKLPA